MDLMLPSLSILQKTSTAGNNFVTILFILILKLHSFNWLYNFSPLNDPDQDHYDCDHKQNMDKSTHRVITHKPQ